MAIKRVTIVVKDHPDIPDGEYRANVNTSGAYRIYTFDVGGVMNIRKSCPQITEVKNDK